jgi:Ig-like domain CHU_C associated/SprB repeat/Pregnancy-associated plasma protein-A
MKQNQLYRLIFLLSIAVCFSFRSSGQECGFHPSEEFINRLKSNTTSAKQGMYTNTRSSVTEIGMKICTIHKTNLSGETQVIVQQEVNRLNIAFEPVGVHFNICSFADIPNNDLAEYETFSQSDVDFINTKCNDPLLINIYIVDKICGDVCAEGNTEPSSNEIFLRRGNLFSPNSSVFIHEMGHLFGLMHTFGKKQYYCDPTKDPNGSDDDIKGDMIPDTPADPGLFCDGSSANPNGCTPANCVPCNCSYVDNTCNYVGGGTYSRFHPQVNNYMAYSRASCYGVFTSGQIDVMKTNISRLRHLTCPTDTPICDNLYEPNNTQPNANIHFSLFGTTSTSESLQGKISNGSDLDYFKIQFTQAGEFRVKMQSPPKNYDLSLFAGSFVRAASNLPNLQSEDMKFTVTAADLNTDFYLLINGAGTSDFDCSNLYNLLVTWQPQTSGGGSCIDQYEPSGYPVNRTAFVDTLGAVFYAKTITANLEDDQDYDAYNITLNHAGELEVTLCGLDNSLNACLEFGYQSVVTSCADGVACQRVVYNLRYNRIYNEKISIIPKIVTNCSKNYTLSVKWTPKDPTGSGGGNAYCSRILDSYEPNETQAQAHFEQKYILNDSLGNFNAHQSGRIRGYLSSPTDIDYHKIQVDKKGIIRFSLCQPDNLNAVLEVRNSSGQVIHTTSQCGTAPSFNVEIGIYYVSIRSLNGTYKCEESYYFEFAYRPTAINGGSNNWTCSEAISLPLNATDNNACVNCPAYTFGTTRGYPNRRTSYGCGPVSNMTGSERLYKVNHVAGGCTEQLRISLRDLESYPDNFAIYLFSDCALNTCVLPSNVTTSVSDDNSIFYEYNNLPTGEYYILIDSKNNILSSYDIAAANYTCPVIISVDYVALLKNSFKYKDIVCSDNLQTYSIKFKLEIDGVATPPTSQYPISSLGDNTFIVSNIPSGQRGLITLREGATSVDLNLVAHTCNCVAIAPTNPQNATLCNGSTAQISVTFPNTEGYEVRWYDTAVGGTILERGINFQTKKAGIYYAEAVQIATGCASNRVLVAVTSPNIPVAVVQKAIVCKGGSDGALTATPLSNLAARYTYKWSTGQTTANIANLNMGTYSVTVTDSSNCSVVLNERLADPQIFARITARDVNCTASSEQTLDAFAYSGGRNLQYRWSRGDTTGTLQNVAYGSYRLTVTDDKGCKTTDSIEVEDKLFYSIAYIENPTCKGRRDGKVTLSVLNGVYPYTFAWNNGKTTPSVDSLIAGRYVVAIQDAKGCRRTDTIDVSEPDSLKLFVNKTNPTCIDSTNGKIAVYVDGGNGLYAYQWNTQATTYNLKNLSAGTFSVQVKDRMNCLASTTIDIPRPDSIRVNPIVKPNPCAEQQKGEITLQVNGGKTPYKYVWQRGDTLAQITGLGVGTYNVMVMDSNRCVVKKTYQINNLPPLESGITAIDTRCSYTQDGILKIDTIKGFPPYQIGIDAQGKSASRNFSNLSVGQHKLIIFDTNNCRWEKGVVPI